MTIDDEGTNKVLICPLNSKNPLFTFQDWHSFKGSYLIFISWRWWLHMCYNVRAISPNPLCLPLLKKVGYQIDMRFRVALLFPHEIIKAHQNNVHISQRPFNNQGWYKSVWSTHNLKKKVLRSNWPCCLDIGHQRAKSFTILISTKQNRSHGPSNDQGWYKSQ